MLLTRGPEVRGLSLHRAPAPSLEIHSEQFFSGLPSRRQSSVKRRIGDMIAADKNPLVP